MDALDKYEILSTTPVRGNIPACISKNGRFLPYYVRVNPHAGHNLGYELRMVDIHKNRHFTVAEILREVKHHEWVDYTRLLIASETWACIYGYNGVTNRFDLLNEWDVYGSETNLVGFMGAPFNNMVVIRNGTLGRLAHDNTFVSMHIQIHPVGPIKFNVGVCGTWFLVNTVIDSLLVRIYEWENQWEVKQTFQHPDVLIRGNRLFVQEVRGQVPVVWKQYKYPEMAVCGTDISLAANEKLCPGHKFHVIYNQGSKECTVYDNNFGMLYASFALRNRGCKKAKFFHGVCWISFMAEVGGSIFALNMRIMCTECGRDNAVYDNRWDSVCSACKERPAIVALGMQRRPGGKYPDGDSGTLHGCPAEIIDRIGEEARKRPRYPAQARLALLLL